MTIARRDSGNDARWRRADGVPGPARPEAPAHVIRSDDEALEVATALARDLADGVADRDGERRWPLAELDRYSQSGLFALNVPRRFGGADVSYATLSRVMAILSAADPSIARLAQNHLGIVAAIRTVSDEAQCALLFADVLRGVRFGYAFSERDSAHAASVEARWFDAGDHVVVRGRQLAVPGALLAHYVPIVAADDQGRAWYALAERNAPGLTVIDDASRLAHRANLAATVRVENVRVPKSHLIPSYLGDVRPSTDGAVFQLLHAAIDVGIAWSAIKDTVRCVRERSRAWVDAEVTRASEDPYVIHAVGELTIRLHAAEASVERAGRAVDRAVNEPTEDTVIAARLAVTESRVLSTELAIDAAHRLAALAEGRPTLPELGLDRPWRAGRRHTLPDTVQGEVATDGHPALAVVAPPSHAWR